MSALTSFLPYLLHVGAVTLVQLLTLFGPGLLLVALASRLSGYVERQASWALGRSLYVLLFGLVGTLVHETSHALAAMLFGISIAGFKPLPSGPRDPVQGYVRTRLDENSLWKKIGYFVIGIAPILFGTLAIFVALLILFERELLDFLGDLELLVPAGAAGLAALPGRVATYALALLGFVFQPAHWLDWRLYLFLYLAFCIGSSIQLSSADIQGAATGFFVLCATWFLLNLATLWLSGLDAHAFDWLVPSYALFYGILTLVIVLNALAALILFIPAMIRRPK